MKSFSECNVSLVDGPPWTWEVVGSNPATPTKFNGWLAQQAEQGAVNSQVVGSNPSPPAIQLGISLVWPKARDFDSRNIGSNPISPSKFAITDESGCSLPIIVL